MNLPKLFEDRMRKLLGEEYEVFKEGYSKPYYSGLRVNTLKITPEEFEAICPFSINRIPWIANGYYYDSNQQPSKHPFYYAGLYYIQEPSAMTPASLLPVEKGDKVLDICAAPGGKSTELGAKLQGEGILVSNDISNSRAKALLKNIELLGISNALVLSEAPNKLADVFPEYFDKILVDAPCSGEGMFRKSPSIMKNWEQYGVEYYNKLQKEIITFAARMLKPGGMMVYSTCTFSPEEDEGTISYLLEQFPEFHVVNAIPGNAMQQKLGLSYEGFAFGKPEWADGKDELKNCIRLWPHKLNGEGHFIALLRKDGDPYRENPSDTIPGRSAVGKDISGKSAMFKNATGKNTMSRNAAAGKKTLLSEEACSFIKKLDPNRISKGEIVVREPYVYLVPKGLPNLHGLRILRQGLLIGEMKKLRFEPSQALASAMNGKEYGKIISLKRDDPNVIRYLKCESVEFEEQYEDGWYLICVEGYPLGWGKITKNQFKNKYLPGWRWV